MLSLDNFNVKLAFYNNNKDRRLKLCRGGFLSKLFRLTYRANLIWFKGTFVTFIQL